MADQTPGDGFMGWLGRQIGYVRGAVKTKAGAAQQSALPQAAVTPPTNPPASAAPPPTPPPPSAIVPQVVYRDEKVEEIEHPDRPGVTLRRTVIDEAIVDPQKATGGSG